MRFFDKGGKGYEQTRFNSDINILIDSAMHSRSNSDIGQNTQLEPDNENVQKLRKIHKDIRGRRKQISSSDPNYWDDYS